MFSFIIFLTAFSCALSDKSQQVIQIIDSGSSNTAGYTIELQRDGIVSWNIQSRPHLSTSTTTRTNSIQLSTIRTNNIFESVENALPLNQYESVFCIKSISFGTTRYVLYNNEKTPDLNCPIKDRRLILLNKYVRELISDLHINTFN